MNPNQNTNIQNTQSFPTPTVPTQQPAKNRRSMLFALFICIFCLLVTCLLIAVLVIQQKNTNSINTQVKALEKRIAAIEAGDKFAEDQLNTDLYQAIFFNNQQTYFGKITKITKDTIKIEDIFYLKTGSVDKAGNPVAGNDVSLTKLGSELHGPQDIMIVERKNILFWENLKADGKVSQAIVTYKKTNPIH